MNGHGGRRPGAGRPKGSKDKHKRVASPGAPLSSNGNASDRGSVPTFSLEDIAAVIRREVQAQAPSPPARPLEERQALTRLADAVADIRELRRRDVTALERLVGLVEQPKTPRINRHRPLE
jgi:hypothetical protein